ncbi:nucleoside diphosphate kinase regulator [Glaciimonas soli]|uniref:Nucleoside diphosphate kinase regulator n=1 Tax=Glaciimonas soli TaxID=2590999 RepID=A0A843YM34_9BURK|nr:nucleoside diphosphate kinase regulator [Glaciimonas soli]MQR00949.1 nucleoside diphosphate kinase regulator [Glaciimonas soli]
MDVKPPISITGYDLERIEQLLDSKLYLNAPGLDALKSELQRASILPQDKIPAGVITMNSEARFVDDKTNTEYTLKLVYPHQANLPNSVSILAPVGSALLGLSVGQSISWQGPGGRDLNLRVLEVTYQPEANGELHL